MANNNIARNFISLLNLGSREQVKKPVKRIRQLRDLEQMSSKETSLDVTAGRVSSTVLPAGALTPSGHYVSDTDAGILGECVACLEEYEQDGTPEMVTLVPKAGGGGGVCHGCGRVFCSEHGAWDQEGRFWCEECARKEKAENVKRAVLRTVFGKFAGLLGGKDE